MKKIICFLFIMLISITLADEKEVENIGIANEEILIKGKDVFEDINFKNIGKKIYTENIKIWICSIDAEVSIEGKRFKYEAGNNTIDICLKDFDIVLLPGKNLIVRLHYLIDKKFEKKIIYPTDQIEIKIITDSFLRANIPIKYENNTYYSSYKPKINEFLLVEFQENEKSIDPIFISIGIFAIFLGLLIIYLIFRRL
ncbi:MAG: hypothetical protein H5T44_03420 [Thermoplasmatales archaeon]|nr:hypothetical protein [Thermoplasmatales archaeon]